MIAINKLGFTNKLIALINAQFCLYKYPYNINKEEHAGYLKKV
jgi:hypothetical protein